MLTKQQVKDQLKDLKQLGYTISPPSRDIEDVEIYINDTDDNTVGSISLSVEDENLYMIEYSRISPTLKGFGKLLYYLALDRVYPNWVCGDMAGFSIEAMKVHVAMANVDYVECESHDGKELAFGTDLDGDFIGNHKFRFRFKD